MCSLISLSEKVIVTKSASDKRNYRALVLENKLKVLLISDPVTDKAAGSLSVGAGSLCNPVELPGLAHFCEHMLFLGTEKFPEENGFDKFLNDNAGGSNAYTDEDHTNYHFDVSPQRLADALERFAYFFINPLFTESSTEREIQAVNSENEQNIPDDDWRSSEIQKHTSDPSHPYQHFATGSLETLWTRPKEKNINITTALSDYHSKFYSANIMTLAVFGSESLDELESIVTPLFTQVINKDVELLLWEKTPFTENEVGVWLHVLPIKDVRQMSIIFPFPDATSSYKAASDHYLTHLLGHEGGGSLLSFLKKKGWANELTAEIQTIARGFGIAALELELTKDGLKNVDGIATIIFQYLELLRSVGPQQWVWEELRDMEAMNFRFKDQQNPAGYTANLTPKMLRYPLEDILSAGYLISQYNPEEISTMLSYLVPEKCRITIFAKENASKVDRVEEFYKIKYSIEKIESELVEKWKNCGLEPELHFPQKNEFIPSCFDLKPRQDTGIIPQLVVNNDISRAFFLQDNEFLLPKAVVYLEIFSPLTLTSAKNQAMIGLLKRTIEDALSEYSYNAQVAGLKYYVMDSVYGFEICVAGYDHKLGLLLEKVVERIAEYSCDEKRFEVLKEAFIRFLKNWEKEQPRKHANWYLGYLLRNKRYTQNELIVAVKDVTKEDLTNFAKTFISNIRLQWLMYGNLSESEATNLVGKCQRTFEAKGSQGISKDQESRLRELKLKPGADFLFSAVHETHSDSCATVLFQSGEDESRANVLIELLDQFAFESCYTQLRTKEQLGYYVSTTVRKANGTRGFQIMVQSGYEPSYIDNRIDFYLESLHETLKGMNEEDFVQHKNALAVRKGEKPKEMIIRGNLLWSEITMQHLKFDRVEVELKELESVTLKDALHFFEDLIGPNATGRKRLNVHIVSKSKTKKVRLEKDKEIPLLKMIERNPCKIDDVCDWKATHEFFPAAAFPDLIHHSILQNVSNN